MRSLSVTACKCKIKIFVRNLKFRKGIIAFAKYF